ncbi:sugar-transfer associated ATP-grasp domain-containing protein, partial [Listeria monocytogenes]|uniref:sugar-transfer associated ATP-grasp domain-containing protein n=1 Tax=Listeria monocytogenes TaxID=1639 RepID=UPI00350E581E
PQFGGLYHDVRETFGIDPSTFVMPFWSEMRDTMRLAARTLKPLRSIGWDVAITPNGPLVVEANENYGIDVLQELSGGYADKPLGLAYLEGYAPKKAPVLKAVNT